MNEYSSISSLQSLSVVQAVTANNIANVNTDGFRASRVTLEEANDMRGVRVQDVSRDETPGPLVERLENRRTESGRMEQVPVTVEGSNVDLVRELTNLILTQRAFEANAAALRSSTGMTGALLDVLV